MMINTDMFRRSLGEHFGGADGWEFQIVTVPSKSKYRLCIVRADNPKLGTSLAIKANKGADKNEEQFRALDALYSQGVQCVRPHYIDKKKRFFVMDWVDAPLLGLELGGNTHDKLIVDAGRWLSNSQKLTVSPSVRPSQLRKPKIRHISGDRTTKRLAASLKKRLKDPSAFQTVPVRLHGDFTIGNIFCAPDGLMGFDAQFDDFGSPFHDAARLLLSLAEARHHAEQSGTCWPGSFEKDRQSFFEGYGPLRPEDVPSFDLFEDCAWFTRWVRLRSRNPGDPSISFFTRELEDRRLLGTKTTPKRPGRLVKHPSEQSAHWTCEEYRDQRFSGAAGRAGPRASKFAVSHWFATLSRAFSGSTKG